MNSRDSSIFKDFKNTKMTGPNHISIHYLVWLLQKLFLGKRQQNTSNSIKCCTWHPRYGFCVLLLGCFTEL